MATPQLNTEMSEPDRRALVKRIAERGSRSEEIKETTVQPSVDYSAAAEAAFAGDPVELPPAATDALSETVNKSANAASRYAEAQRAIFARGRGREAAYGNEFLDDTKIQIEATNTDLKKYEQDLAKAEAARMSYSSGSGRVPGSDYSDPLSPSSPGGGSATHPLTDTTGSIRREAVDFSAGYEDREFIDEFGEEYDNAFSEFGAQLDSGTSYTLARKAAFDYLMGTGMGETNARRLLDTLRDVWLPQFDASDQLGEPDLHNRHAYPAGSHPLTDSTGPSPDPHHRRTVAPDYRTFVPEVDDWMTWTP